MNKNILDFYMIANKLKDIVRTGWIELGVERDRVESVAEHVYGTLVLALALDSEYKLDLDLLKVFKMLIIKELEKVNLNNFTPREYPTKEEKKRLALETISNTLSSLSSKDELLEIYEEYSNKENKEAIFTYKLSKIESDIQVKIYDLDGCISIEKAKEDVSYYEEPVEIKNASDGWIKFNRRFYNDELFSSLSKDIEEL
ncbi:MAG: HD domain-containing protein [Bacilli bacterium]|nr:HD domain-containing protein [Bacilli bacterium]